MFKTVASTVACLALMGLALPASPAHVAPSTGQSVELCERGDKTKDKKVDRPAEAYEIVSLCDRGGKKKGGERGDGQPAE